MILQLDNYRKKDADINTNKGENFTVYRPTCNNQFVTIFLKPAKKDPAILNAVKRAKERGW